MEKEKRKEKKIDRRQNKTRAIGMRMKRTDSERRQKEEDAKMGRRGSWSGDF
jgi:hypothetical protein